MERSSQIRSYTGEASWEAKAVAIIGCITDLEVGAVVVNGNTFRGSSSGIFSFASLVIQGSKQAVTKVVSLS